MNINKLTVTSIRRRCKYMYNQLKQNGIQFVARRSLFKNHNEFSGEGKYNVIFAGAIL